MFQYVMKDENGNFSVELRWALCDGNNGTPNLLDRFIKSVGTAENPGATGGSATHTHVAHAALSHTGTAVADHASMSHSGCAVANHTSVATKQGTAAGNVVTTNTHTVTQPSAHPALTHSVTQPAQHAAQSHDTVSNEPAYFKLAYIMKI